MKAPKTNNMIHLVSVYPFQGDATHSQLSFPVGASIVAPPGQPEAQAWWYGSYGSQRGWFPPSYCRPQLSLKQSDEEERSPTTGSALPTVLDEDGDAAFDPSEPMGGDTSNTHLTSNFGEVSNGRVFREGGSQQREGPAAGAWQHNEEKEEAIPPQQKTKFPGRKLMKGLKKKTGFTGTAISRGARSLVRRNKVQDENYAVPVIRIVDDDAETTRRAGQ
jgi:hypothetical protein